MNETPDTTNKRPTFLTVLCILSFIAAGISIVMSVLGFMAMNAASGYMDAATDIATDEMGELGGMMGDMMGDMMKHASTLLYVGIALTVLSLIGVIMMWKLKKVGFFIYTGANIIGIIFPIILIGMMGFNLFGTIITIAFIVMYGMNMKHMS